MDFLSPHFFYGLFALLIPVLVHLFNFRKRKKVFFSSTRFLRKASEETKSQRKLKQWLILASRILFLLFLILAFARPYLPANESALGARVQIYLDNSLSMTNEVAPDLPAIDRAIEMAGNIVDLYPEGTRFRLITNEFSPFSNRYRTGAEVKEMLTETKVVRMPRNLAEVYNRLTDEMAGKEPGDIYWISDFQRSGNTAVSVDTSFSPRLVPLYFNGEQNIYIDTLYLKTPVLMDGGTTTLVARMKNRAEADREDVGLKVLIDGVQVSAGSYDIPAAGENIAEIDIEIPKGGSAAGVFSIEDYPVSFDNELYFTVKSGSRVKIAEIKGSSSTNYVSKVFANTDLFRYESFGQQNVDLGKILEADLVILNELQVPSEPLMIQLNNLLTSNGSVVVIPARNKGFDYVAQLSGKSYRLATDTTAKRVLSSPDVKNPFFANVFEEQVTSMATPSTLKWLELPSDRDALLSYKDGSPYLSVTRSPSGGKIFLFASSFGQEVTDFPQHALFLPVMYKIAEAAAGKGDPLYHLLTDSQFKVAIDSVIPNEVFRLSGPAGEFIPAQYLSGETLFLEIPDGQLQSGHYTLTSGKSPAKILAFNHGNAESDLSQYAMEELTGLFPNGKPEVLLSEAESNFTSIIEQKYRATELWWIALLLSLVFLCTEIALLKLMK